jgi:hypothetical protein
LKEGFSMAATLNSEDIALILAAVEGSAVLAKAAQIVAISGPFSIQSFITSSTVIQGTETLTVAALTADDDTKYVVTDAGAGIDFILLASPFDDHAVPVTLHFHGYYDENAGSTNSCSVKAYNFDTASWGVLIVLVNAASDAAHDLPLVGSNRAPDVITVDGVVCAKGDVLIRFTQTDTEAGSDVFLDHMLVGFAGVDRVSQADLAAALAPLALEASVTPLALEASLAPLALQETVVALPAATAGLVWDEDISLHVAAGSSGAQIQVSASDPPSPADIANAVLAAIVTGAVTVEDVLALLYGAQASGGAGGGALPFVVTINVGGQPADGVEVWISTDLEGDNIVAGTLTTDAFGVANFMLDAGTYQLWKQKAGVNFTNPEEIVVS